MSKYKKALQKYSMCPDLRCGGCEYEFIELLREVYEALGEEPPKFSWVDRSGTTHGKLEAQVKYLREEVQRLRTE